MTRKKSLILLLLITFFAFGQRFYQLSSNPPALNWDEVSHGYNAYSILKTGADEWGFRFPLIFRAFGDYKLPLYIYLTLIPVYFLGLTPVAVRLVSVLAGTLAIPAIYLLTTQLFSRHRFRTSSNLQGSTKDLSSDGSDRLSDRLSMRALPMWNPPIGLLAAFLLSISPWHFFISRPALEANLALTLIIFAAWSLLKGLKNSRYYLLSSLIFGLSLHTYNTARIFVPLILLSFLVIYFKRLKLSKDMIISIGIFLLFFIPVVFQVVSGPGLARYSKLSILSDYAVYQIGQDRLNSPLSPPLARLLHNRPLFFVKQFSKNYLSYFSPSFLYQIQGPQWQFAIPGKNLFTLPVTILSLVGGLWLLLRPRHSGSSGIFLFSWLLLSPLAAALTADPPQSIRPNPLIPVIIIFSSLGLFIVASWFRKHSWASKTIFVGLLISCLFAYIRYLNDYYGSYKTIYSMSWQYGYQQVFDFIKPIEKNYQRIIITKYYGEPHIFYAFFNKLDPRILQPGGGSLRFRQSDWFWTDKINNVYFVNDWDIPKKLAATIPLESGGKVALKDSLLVVSPASLPQNAKILKTINFLDGSPAFIIITVNNEQD